MERVLFKCHPPARQFSKMQQFQAPTFGWPGSELLTSCHQPRSCHQERLPAPAARMRETKTGCVGELFICGQKVEELLVESSSKIAHLKRYCLGGTWSCVFLLLGPPLGSIKEKRWRILSGGEVSLGGGLEYTALFSLVLKGENGMP